MYINYAFRNPADRTPRCPVPLDRKWVKLTQHDITKRHYHAQRINHPTSAF